MFWQRKDKGVEARVLAEGLAGLEAAEAPVSRALLTVCEKCGRKLAGDKDAKDTPSTELRKALKEKCAEAFGKGVVRPVTSSCMDICPRDRIAVGFLPVGGKGGGACFFTVDPSDPARVSGEILEVLARMPD